MRLGARACCPGEGDRSAWDVHSRDWLLQNCQIDLEHLDLWPYGIGLVLGAFIAIALLRGLRALKPEQRLREREAELEQSHARLRAVERDQVLAQERERLMQDMHDGLGSSLMGALKAVEHGHRQNLAQVLRECIEDLKLTIDSLEPAQADLLLLLATLRFRLGTRLEQAGILLRWAVDDVPPLPWLEPRSALHILRILQEVLGNAVRHSGASRIVLSTRHAGDRIMVCVEDDGSGFDPAAPAHTGRGLAHVRHRAQAIGATVAWQALQPHGMRFELGLPVQAPPPRCET